MRVDADWSVCLYCGVVADAMDHLPPRAARGTLDPLSSIWPFIEVPSCIECNRLIGTDQPWDLVARIEEIKNRIRKKYVKVLELPVWTAMELHNLGPQMADSIRSAQIAQQWVRDRLRYRGLYGHTCLSDRTGGPSSGA